MPIPVKRLDAYENSTGLSDNDKMLIVHEEKTYNITGKNVANYVIGEIPKASSSISGITKLTNAVSSTSTDTAATANSVKITYDKVLSVEGSLTNVETSLNNVKSTLSNVETSLGKEITRATSIENSLRTDTDAAAKSIKTTHDKVLSVEGSLTNVETSLNNVKSSLSGVETSLNKEITRATSIENSIRSDLNSAILQAGQIKVDDALSSTSINSVQNKVIHNALSGKAEQSHEHSYAGSTSAGGAATTALECTGNAATATRWSKGRNINGMLIYGDGGRTNYGTCSTVAATAAKTVACFGFQLITGAEFTVNFTITNTASSPTLNVNDTGAMPMYYRGKAIKAGYLAANRTYTFRYNGAQYDLVGDINEASRSIVAVSEPTDLQIGDEWLQEYT